MHSPMGPNGPGMGPNGPMGSPMGGGSGTNNSMMVPCSKSSPMGMGGPPSAGGAGGGGGSGSGPDPTQPLPPSGMGPGNGYNKNSPIMGGGPGPATTDPNYAQQFHNFQQQLYATNTRSQGMGGGGGGPPAMPPHRGPTPPQLNNQNWLPSGPMSK